MSDTAPRTVDPSENPNRQAIVRDKSSGELLTVGAGWLQTWPDDFDLVRFADEEPTPAEVEAAQKAAEQPATGQVVKEQPTEQPATVAAPAAAPQPAEQPAPRGRF